MTERLTYIDEVCAALLDDTERKYIMARTHLEQVTAANTMPQEKHADQIETAHKDYLRSSKEYLAVAFKTKFLGVDLKKLILVGITAFAFSTLQLSAQDLPSCPGSNADPSKFCPVGQQWSDAAQDCIVMA